MTTEIRLKGIYCVNSMVIILLTCFTLYSVIIAYTNTTFSIKPYTAT